MNRGEPCGVRLCSFIFGSIGASVDELYFLGFARLGCRSFVGISEGNAVEQFIAFAEVQFLQIFGCFGRLHEAGRAAETAGTDTHGLGCKYHVAAQ